MKNLDELIGKSVYANFSIDDEKSVTLKCEVYDVRIDDFYFEEKSEPIYFTASLSPLEEVPEELDEEDFYEFPIADLRKA